jgi:hypothetical protein
MGKPKEAFLYLEEALQAAPRSLNKLLALDPAILQNNAVIEVIARNKRSRSK